MLDDHTEARHKNQGQAQSTMEGGTRSESRNAFDRACAAEDQRTVDQEPSEQGEGINQGEVQE